MKIQANLSNFDHCNLSLWNFDPLNFDLLNFDLCFILQFETSIFCIFIHSILKTKRAKNFEKSCSRNFHFEQKKIKVHDISKIGLKPQNTKYTRKMTTNFLSSEMLKIEILD